MKLDTVYNKSCQRMDELPDGSVDVALTSSPYWGLRDYGDDVREIWGGDSDCQHKFDALLRGHHPGQVPQTKKQVASGSKDSGQFCSLCNAWYGQLGLEPTFQLYLDHMAAVCAEVMRVLKGTGSFWLNMGDTYSSKPVGHFTGGGAEFTGRNMTGIATSGSIDKTNSGVPAKCMLGIPWRLALRLVDEQGWILRNAIVWAKPNAMPSSVKDRCSNGYEFLFHLVKEKKYYYDLDAVREPIATNAQRRFTKTAPKDSGYREDRKPSMSYRYDNQLPGHPAGRNPGDVWTIPTQPRPEAHFATFPDKLCIKPILATCPQEICRKCGKARVRITKRESGFDKQNNCLMCGQPRSKHHQSAKSGLRFSGSFELDGTIPCGYNQTIGWTNCGCNAGFEPGIVLDPFAGRGTALIMAKKLGRHYVGYELKKEYCEKLIEPALRDIDPLFS